ncbi:MAG: lysophospholipid acyltransferase family protein [Butyricicoccus pullicaecorum]|nr:1-acyl-sn-glycerol-3-phosphate acyltransferase [Butyricicoccus pullicaecorum]MDO4668953.1 lysophospholipid acyltransferase family protein [Butyricicoccus pullicaecorum]
MRTIIWFIYFWAYILLSLPVSAYIWVLEKRGLHKRADQEVQGMVERWAHRLMRLAGVSVHITGQENLPEGAAVYVANHQGYFDIPIMLTSLREPHGLVAKKEIDRLPGIRAWMRHLHCLFVDRSSPRAGAQVILDGEKLLRSGRSVTIFPEGTRSRGGAMHAFKAGAFRIAARAEAPIVPVTIDGSYRIMEANNFWIQPGEIFVTIHSAIETKGMSRDALKALPEQVKEIIASAL